MSVHLTAARNAVVSPHGWRRLPSGVWVTALPLVALDNWGRFSHLDYDTTLAAAERLRARLLAPATVVELNAHGHRLKPEISAPGADMSSRARCDAHDDAVAKQLIEGWDGERPVANAGKPWVSGALPGKSRLFGWSKRADASGMGPQDFGDWWQPLQNAHNRRHADYSSLVTLEADSDLGVEPLPWDDTPPDTDPIPDTRRKAEALVPAHGYRCSVRELVADARDLKTWRPMGTSPEVGDLIISARLGGDPTKGGNGHVERVSGLAPLRTIGGNEGNAWAEAPYDLASKDYRGYISCGALGRRALDVARAELLRGDVRERPGAQHHPRIQLYHAGARRYGGSMAGMPGHALEGQGVLGDAAADEVPWCASSASWCTREALLG